MFAKNNVNFQKLFKGLYIWCYFRLGGVPLGVVSVETRTVEVSIPADPANFDSEAKVSLVIHLSYLSKSLFNIGC
jgi:hypothetical protein